MQLGLADETTTQQETQFRCTSKAVKNVLQQLDDADIYAVEEVSMTFVTKWKVK
jgi:hypothetical protein